MLNSLTIEKYVRAALEEDLGHGRDVTSEVTVPEGASAKATLVAREEGVLAGMIVALSAFSLIDGGLDMIVHGSDGDPITPGFEIAHIAGSARSLLMAERVALNFLSHMSGVATLTNRFVQEIEGTAAEICDTRKTLPGLRTFQKYAVNMGGGSNHRLGLDDAILIKDNHIAIAGDIRQVLDQARLIAGHTVKIEIEVDTIEQLEAVLESGNADIVMLDNMDFKTLKSAVDMAKGKLITEASGGVTLETVREIAETGVDYISVGALTHSVKALDIALDFQA
ncbi:MAG: carboxylating nicotinate-nucleotide diphosphorylase [Pseudomonadota bacterium]